ncbi:MAG: T9SS type A sorting domain-containing protein, partial [Saprospiraceae bacterium]|nr:T9SS type A sorting domain-containing protein [Saprospiraceae bacterium]
TPLHHIAVNIYNTQGQLVDRLHELGPAEEEHRFYWKTENVLSGIYFLEITADLKKRFLPVVVNHN